jgi:hypothetical protein
VGILHSGYWFWLKETKIKVIFRTFCPAIEDVYLGRKSQGVYSWMGYNLYEKPMGGFSGIGSTRQSYFNILLNWVLLRLYQFKYYWSYDTICYAFALA